MLWEINRDDCFSLPRLSCVCYFVATHLCVAESLRQGVYQEHPKVVAKSIFYCSTNSCSELYLFCPLPFLLLEEDFLELWGFSNIWSKHFLR